MWRLLKNIFILFGWMISILFGAISFLKTASPEIKKELKHVADDFRDLGQILEEELNDINEGLDNSNQEFKEYNKELKQELEQMEKEMEESGMAEKIVEVEIFMKKVSG